MRVKISKKGDGSFAILVSAVVGRRVEERSERELSAEDVAGVVGSLAASLRKESPATLSGNTSTST